MRGRGRVRRDRAAWSDLPHFGAVALLVVLLALENLVVEVEHGLRLGLAVADGNAGLVAIKSRGPVTRAQRDWLGPIFGAHDHIAGHRKSPLTAASMARSR